MLAAGAALVSNEAVNGAVALWVRADWRRRSRLIVALALLVGVAGAVVLISFAGARRTASSVDRLEGETRAADIVVDVNALDPEIADAIARLPMVKASGAFTIVFAVVDGVEADLGLWVPRDNRIGAEIESYRVLRGRRPAFDRPDEVAVNEPAVAILGVDVGDEVSIDTLTPEQVRDEEYFPPRGPRLDVHVVGVLRGVDDLDDDADGGFVASPALFGTIQGKVDEFATYLAVGLTEGATLADFETAVADLIPPDQEYQTLTGETRAHAARRNDLVAGIRPRHPRDRGRLGRDHGDRTGSRAPRHCGANRCGDTERARGDTLRPGRRARARHPAKCAPRRRPGRSGGLAGVADHADRAGAARRARPGSLRRLGCAWHWCVRDRRRRPADCDACRYLVDPSACRHADGIRTLHGDRGALTRPRGTRRG